MQIQWSESGQAKGGENAPSEPPVETEVGGKRRLLNDFLSFGATGGKAAVLTLLVGVGVGLLLHARRGDDVPISPLRSPTFLKVPEPANKVHARRTIGWMPVAYDLPRLTSRELSTLGMLRGTGGNATSFCNALATDGFPNDGWKPSRVFKGEWECASSTRPDAAGEDGEYFFVLRGHDDGKATNVLFKVTLGTNINRARAAADANRFLILLSQSFGTMFPPELPQRLSKWKDFTIESSTGKIRLKREVMNNNRYNLTIDLSGWTKTLESPPDLIR